MNILTFDVEEWFHILDNSSTKSINDWSKFESRIHSNMDKIFSFLNSNNLKATFFVVGWIAEKYPDIIKKIDSFGYEIGSHTYAHQLMYEQTKNQVKEDLIKSIDILQNLTGKKVESFRAPGFSIKECNKWVFEVLIDNGILYDCSVFPANRAHGGFPRFKESYPSKILISNKFLKEFPINTTNVLKFKIIFSGGGYFRLMPYNLIKYWSKNSKYLMTYFHPRDFDPNQPVIEDLNYIRKFKSYVGLNNCMNKLERWVNDFSFVDLKTADSMINWENTSVIKF